MKDLCSCFYKPKKGVVGGYVAVEEWHGVGGSQGHTESVLETLHMIIEQPVFLSGHDWSGCKNKLLF